MSAASEREKVLARYGTASCVKGDDCTDFDCVAIRSMADRIVELEERVKHLACPTCGTVNPPEVHTCTPRPRVTVTDRWAVVDADGDPYSVIRLSHDSAVESAQAYDQNVPESAPHTVKRVALIDTGEG